MGEKIINVFRYIYFKRVWNQKFLKKNFRNINKIEEYNKFKFKEFSLTSFSKPTESD
jgi:hypothetical protein